jgi:hypothetical protein
MDLDCGPWPPRLRSCDEIEVRNEFLNWTYMAVAWMKLRTRSIAFCGLVRQRRPCERESSQGEAPGPLSARPWTGCDSADSPPNAKTLALGLFFSIELTVHEAPPSDRCPWAASARGTGTNIRPAKNAEGQKTRRERNGRAFESPLGFETWQKLRTQ